MDQLHRAHDNGRAANAPAQTRNLTEHRAAQINDRKNTTDASGEQGPEARTGESRAAVVAPWHSRGTLDPREPLLPGDGPLAMHESFSSGAYRNRDTDGRSPSILQGKN